MPQNYLVTKQQITSWMKFASPPWELGFPHPKFCFHNATNTFPYLPILLLASLPLMSMGEGSSHLSAQKTEYGQSTHPEGVMCRSGVPGWPHGRAQCVGGPPLLGLCCTTRKGMKSTLRPAAMVRVGRWQECAQAHSGPLTRGCL